MAISRALDELIHKRPLFPHDPGTRGAVEEAERWGHDELQPLPRRIFRWAVVDDPSLRRWVARRCRERRTARAPGALAGRFPTWAGEMPYFEVPGT
jgi:glutathione S-transferase